MDNNTGAIPPGLTQGITALSFNNATFGNARSIAFNTNVLHPFGTKTDALAAIANPANWTVPEPSALLMIITGSATLLLFQRRR